MIIGKRVTAGDRKDLPRFVAWLNDPEVRATSLLSTPLMGQEELWYAAILKEAVDEQPLCMMSRMGKSGNTRQYQLHGSIA
jgi:hypothetical protein